MSNIKQFNQYVKENYNDYNVMNVCHDCMGDGMIDNLECVGCRGLGFMSTPEQDPRNNNDITFEDKDHRFDCPKCEGTGKDLEGCDCHFCEGIGYVNNDHGLEKVYNEEEEVSEKTPTCPSCDGDGKLDGYVCNYCDGSGRIPLTDNYNKMHEKKGLNNSPDTRDNGKKYWSKEDEDCLDQTKHLLLQRETQLKKASDSERKKDIEKDIKRYKKEIEELEKNKKIGYYKK